MKLKKQSFLSQVASGLMLTATLMLGLGPAAVAPPARALDVQTLNDTVAGQSGFTHAARVTWDDINAADASTVTLSLGPIPTNSYVDRVAFVVEEAFTNATIANTNLTIAVGVGGSTNRFFGTNYLDGGTARMNAGETRVFALTNLLIPYISTTSTNYVTVTISDGAATSVVDNYAQGKVRIYWRLVQPSRWRF